MELDDVIRFMLYQINQSFDLTLQQFYFHFFKDPNHIRFALAFLVFMFTSHLYLIR